jgi:DNA replication protein DnaD
MRKKTNKAGKFFTIDLELFHKLESVENSSDLVNSLLSEYFRKREERVLTREEMIQKREQLRIEQSEISNKIIEIEMEELAKIKEKAELQAKQEYNEANKERLKEEFIKTKTEWIESILPELEGDIKASMLAEKYYNQGEGRKSLRTFLMMEGYLQR